MKEFEVKPEHLLLLGNMYVSWNDVEFGAPEISPKRPYGNSDVIGDMMEIFDIDPARRDEVYQELFELHQETWTALQILLRCGTLELGTYVADSYRQNWQRND